MVSKFWLLLATLPLCAQSTRMYVAALDDKSCTLAWGIPAAKGINTVGRTAPGIGKVTLRLGSQELSTSAAWHRVEGLKPDTTYRYELLLNGKTLGAGSVRTWPNQTRSLTFFVIGDWGNGSRTQYAIAERMEKERVRLESTASPVRFVLSTGDNIYGGGSRDRDWESKFFAPYANTLSAIPFYAVLGNHDGNESEKSADLPAYLDNFFSPAGAMTRWYRFRYGDFVDFFALDSTTNQHPGAKAPVYLAGGDQSRWLADQLQQSAAPWRLAVFHHPMFTAGPNHPPAVTKLGHWLSTFRDAGFSAVFSGHEHNLQFSERNKASGEVQYVLSGAGGELRAGNVKSRMQARNISAWAPQAHFLVVHIEGNVMSITPISNTPLRLSDPAGKPVPVPLIVPRRQP
jgi:tartrate-resistant acid phosphatase type 5